MTYEDPFSAGSAVEWFNDKEFKGMLQDIIFSSGFLTKVRPSFPLCCRCSPSLSEAS